MEHRLVGVPSPAFTVGGVGTEHVIVGQEVLVAEVLGGSSVASDHIRVGAYLALWESDAYLHARPPPLRYLKDTQRSASPSTSRLDANDPCEPSKLSRCACRVYIYLPLTYLI